MLHFLLKNDPRKQGMTFVDFRGFRSFLQVGPWARSSYQAGGESIVSSQNTQWEWHIYLYMND